jgi:hypothetical protein
MTQYGAVAAAGSARECNILFKTIRSTRKRFTGFDETSQAWHEQKNQTKSKAVSKV